MVWLVHTQKLKCILRNFRCEGKLIKTECSKRALTEISSKLNGNACYADYASGEWLFFSFLGEQNFTSFYEWSSINSFSFKKGENTWLMCRKPTGRTLGRALKGRALSCLELMRTRAPPVERLSYRACDSVNFLFGNVCVFRWFWAVLQLKR